MERVTGAQQTPHHQACHQSDQGPATLRGVCAEHQNGDHRESDPFDREDREGDQCGIDEVLTGGILLDAQQPRCRGVRHQERNAKDQRGCDEHRHPDVRGPNRQDDCADQHGHDDDLDPLRQRDCPWKARIHRKHNQQSGEICRNQGKQGTDHNQSLPDLPAGVERQEQAGKCGRPQQVGNGHVGGPGDCPDDV